jgi:hypothetical protein
MSSDVRVLYYLKVELWATSAIKFGLTITTSTDIVRDFLHATKLRHGTNGFTSLPKEGMLRTFSPGKSDGFGRV